MRVREQLMLGATQIKLTAGGGVASPHSPLDASTFTEPELRAAVEAAENWGTYVTVHAYTPASIQRAIAAGVKCIEHGHLMDEATAKLIAEKGIWLSMQPFPDEMADAFPPGSHERAKALEVFAGTDSDVRAGEEVQDQDGVRHRHPVLRELAQRQGELLAKLVRWYTPAEALVDGDRDQRRNCWRCPGSAIPIPASSASSRKARSPTCCSSTAIRSRTSS